MLHCKVGVKDLYLGLKDKRNKKVKWLYWNVRELLFGTLYQTLLFAHAWTECYALSAAHQKRKLYY